MQRKFKSPYSTSYWIFGEGTIFPNGDFYSSNSELAWPATISIKSLESAGVEEICMDPDLISDKGL